MSDLKLDLDRIRWDDEGLVPIIVQGVDGRVLMLAYADREALEKTLETSRMHYWSRSRKRLWQKGETSGHVQRVISLDTDCDQDAMLARVVQEGPACHTGAPTCFGDSPSDAIAELWRVFAERAHEPKSSSYVNELLSDEPHLRRKVAEEGLEVALAQASEELLGEAADVVFHLCVLLFARGLTWSDVLSELTRRHQSP